MIVATRETGEVDRLADRELSAVEWDSGEMFHGRRQNNGRNIKTFMPTASSIYLAGGTILQRCNESPGCPFDHVVGSQDILPALDRCNDSTPQTIG